MQGSDAVLRALAAEAHAIRHAKFGDLAPLQAQISTLLQGMQAAAIPHDDLLEIKRRIEENQTRLKAAIRGIKAARARMEELITVQQGLVIYDQAGLRDTMPSLPKTIEKKV